MTVHLEKSERPPHPLRSLARRPRLAVFLAVGLAAAAGWIYLAAMVADMVPAIEPNADAMRAAALRGFATATDLADYLVRRGLPFRDAHEVVGKAVAHGLETGRDLAEMDLETLRRFSTSIDDDVFAVLTLEGSVAAREHIGGTAPVEVRAAAGRALARVEARVKQG